VKFRAFGVAAAVALILTSCSTDEEVASQAISDSIMANNTDFVMTRPQADCAADGLVDRLGVESLQKDGVLDSEGGLGQVEMSQEDANVAADVMAGCIDFRELFTSAMPVLPEESRRCVDEKLTDEVLNDYVTSVLVNEREQAQEDLALALADCVRLGG